jgi:hypothetical protein
LAATAGTDDSPWRDKRANDPDPRRLTQIRWDRTPGPGVCGLARGHSPLARGHSPPGPRIPRSDEPTHRTMVPGWIGTIRAMLDIGPAGTCPKHMRRRAGHPAGPSHGVGAGAPSADRQAVAITADGPGRSAAATTARCGCGTWPPGRGRPLDRGTTPLSPVPCYPASLSRLPWDSNAACPTHLSSVARRTPPDQSQSPCPHRPVLLLVGHTRAIPAPHLA